MAIVPPKHQTSAAALLLVLVLHLCFFPFLWGNQTLLTGARGVASVMPDGAWYGGRQGPGIFRCNDPGASSWMTEADAPLLRHQYLREKRLPLWNPYQAYGAPLAANMQSQPFNPLYILYALHPGPRTYNLFILCRFLIAGLGAYLYLRLFLPFAPALAGGIVSMLAGYYVLFYNMPHLSVDVLLPALFFALERLLRRQTIGSVLLVVLTVFLVLAGGMPESALLLLAFGSAYFLFRVLTGIRRAAWQPVLYFVAAHALAFALAAFLLAPFAEFLRVGYDLHQVRNLGHITGADHDPLGLSIFTYLVPTLYGTAWFTPAPGLGGFDSLRGFFGIFPVLLGLVAAGSLREKVPHRRLIAFFLASAIAVVLRRYGAPVVNWTGYLPFFQLVRLTKYEEVIAAFSVAALSAFAVDQILARRVSRRRLAVSLALASLLLVAAVAFSLPAVLAAHAPLLVYGLSLGGACGILFAAAWLFWVRWRTPGWLAASLLALLVCQMAGNYIFPVYYWITRSAPDSANPYRGAPYIGFLKSNLRGYDRIFARDGLLFPDWAGAFQIADIRGVDALYYWKYLPFVRFFLRGEAPRAPHGNLVERFTGAGDHPFDTPLKQRLLQLSSVAYVLSVRPFPDSTPFRLVYDDHQVKIYENPQRLPRAALYSSVELAPDDAAALARLGSPPFNIFRTAVVSAPGLRPAEAAALRALNASEPAAPARIVEYSSQEAAIDASPARLALLVLNDSDYPGWKVYLDGKPAHALTANYMFRGVLIPPGRHHVRFAYQPASFAMGASISAAGLLGLAAFILWRRRLPGSGVAETHLVQ